MSMRDAVGVFGPHREHAPMDVKLFPLLTDGPMRLQYIPRYATAMRLHEENVATHSFHVAFYVLVLGTAYNMRREPGYVDLGEAMARALLHDIEEAEFGDLPRPFTRKHAELKPAFDQMKELGADTCLAKIMKRGPVSEALGRWWKFAKDEATLEGRLVRFCDFLSVASFFLVELAAQNFSMQQYAQEVIPYAHTFDDPKYDFLRPWVQEVQDILDIAFRP